MRKGKVTCETAPGWIYTRMWIFLALCDLDGNNRADLYIIQKLTYILWINQLTENDFEKQPVEITDCPIVTSMLHEG